MSAINDLLKSKPKPYDAANSYIPITKPNRVMINGFSIEFLEWLEGGE